MKIKDILVDWIITTDVFEMAFERKVVIDKIRALQIQIAKNLIKHLYYDVPESTKSHWEREINTWLSDIDEYRLKKNKTLDGSVYYKLLFLEPVGERSDVTRKIQKINNDENMERHEGLISIDLLHENLEKILHKVSYDIANGKLKSISFYIEGIRDCSSVG